MVKFTKNDPLELQIILKMGKTSPTYSKFSLVWFGLIGWYYRLGLRCAKLNTAWASYSLTINYIAYADCLAVGFSWELNFPGWVGDDRNEVLRNRNRISWAKFQPEPDFQFINPVSYRPEPEFRKIIPVSYQPEPEFQLFTGFPVLNSFCSSPIPGCGHVHQIQICMHSK